MPKRYTKPRGKAKSRVLGDTAFAAISAAEGSRMNAASKKRLARLRALDLTQEQRRDAVMRAYGEAKKK